MPTPYLSCKLISPMFGDPSYQWYETPPAELSAATEISGFIIKAVLSNTAPTLLQTVLNSMDEKTRKVVLPPTSSWRKSPLKISLELFKELDQSDNSPQSLKSLTQNSNITINLVEQIIKLSDTYTIAINFREVFLIPKDETPPLHYRPGIDLTVDNLKDYKYHTSKASYQIAKRLFNVHALRYSPNTVSSSLIEHYQTKNIARIKQNAFCDLSTPLTELPYFNSPDEALSSVISNWRHIKGRTLILAFGPTVSIADLSIVDNMRTHELIIILYGEQYKDAKERQLVYENTVQLIDKTSWYNPLHVLLVTQKTSDHNVLTLAPDSQKEINGFSPLTEETGYYLSDPVVFSFISRIAQQPDFTAQWFDDFQKKSQIPSLTAPASKKTSPYIYSKEETADFRKSKRFNQKTLKAQIALSLNYQQDLSQTQVLSQKQVLSQQQILSQKIEQGQQQNMQSSFHWGMYYFFDEFCQELLKFAERQLLQQTKQQQLLDQIYLTKFYREHHSKDYYLKSIINDKEFRVRVAAGLFGIAYTGGKEEHSLVHLPNYSVDSIAHNFIPGLLYSIKSLKDGLNPDNRSVALNPYLFGGRMLTKFNANSRITDNYFSPAELPIVVSSLALLNTTETPTYQSHLHYSVLLRESDLVDLSIVRQQVLITIAETMLNLFKINPTTSTENVAEREVLFIELIKFYFPARPDYINNLKKLFALFEEHNDDNLRILIQILISGHKDKMEDFFKFLVVLNSRSLLKNFYLIYFKYANHMFSIVNLLKNINYVLPSKSRSGSALSLLYSAIETPFIDLAFSTSIVTSVQNWPLFEKFCHHVLVFAAQNNHGMHAYQLHNMQGFWNRLSAKFLAYTGHQEQEAQELMESLVHHLIAKEGLSLASLGKAETFYVGLEKLIDHAMANRTLQEQLAEIGGISLLWTDTPYAIAANNFQVVCAEMKLCAAAINPKTKGYSVSLDELKATLKNHQPGDGFLKTALFRYLGTERFREDLSFYRDLFTAIQQSKPDAKTSDIKERYLEELLLAYYVSTTTGTNYNSQHKQKQFSIDFIAFLQSNPLTKDIEPELVSTALVEFFDRLSHSRTDVQKGTTTLWGLWHEKALPILAKEKAPIPEILTQKFEKNQLKRFLLKNSPALTKCAPLLKQDPELVYTLLRSWFSEEQTGKFERTSLILLKLLYPKLSLTIFLRDIVKITAFIESHAILVQRGARGKLYAALSTMFEQESTIDLALVLIDLVSNEMAQDKNNKKQDSLAAHFINELAKHPRCLSNINASKPLLALMLNYYLSVNIKNVSLPLLFTLTNTLMPLGIEKISPILTLLLTSMKSSEGYEFFSDLPRLSAPQLDGLAQVMQQIGDLSITIPFIQLCMQKQPEQDFAAIQNELKTLSQEHSRHIVFISHLMCSSSTQPILEQLVQLKKLPARTLKQVIHLYDLYSIKRQDFIDLLASPSIPEAIAQFERAKHAKNKERYDYNPGMISAKIAQIKHKSSTGEELALNVKTQEQLLKDYEQLMSYMTQKTILIEQDSAGIKKEFTIYELSETQFQILFKRLIEQINKGEHKKDYQLMVLALCCEALYRTTNKFPRNTQILNLLNSMNQEGDLIHEVQTGEGKSIIAAFHGVLLYDGKKSIDIVTENNHLANEGLNKFKHFYNYIGIPCGAGIIEAHSPYNAYVEQGINYSTASNLALFRARMKLGKKYLSNNVSLICDEIDANLTTLVQYRLAATIDPMLLDTTSWSVVYKVLLAFVKEKDIFIDNKCTNDEDIANFKNYLILKNPGKELTDFIDKLSKDLLSTLIESAQIAHELEDNIDYVVLTKSGEKTSYYAAPILASTKRPDPRVSFSASVQQLLHTKLNNEQPPPKYTFEIEPSSETLVVVSAKNFFDSYRLNGGRTIGLTGTAGTLVELQEFKQHHGLTAFNYPTFHDNLCEDLGVFAAIGPEEHQQLILQRIQEHKKNTPSQPILIITSSPQETLRLNNYLAANTSWEIQSYSGHEHAGLSETKVLHKAGMDHIITIANESLARGADIDPVHPRGLFVINASTEVTASALRQIKGRTARNGKPGLFCSIIDATPFASPTSTPAEIALAFQAHQHTLSVQQQKQRLKPRLLEESRYHIVNNYLLEVIERADKILCRQYGRNSSLVSPLDLMLTLSRLNHRAEQHYTQLLEKHSTMEGTITDEFLAARVTDYQHTLTRWLPDERFKNFQPIEPLIPLDNLKTLTALHSIKMEHLILLSDLFSKAWKQIGHQKMQIYFAKLDKLQESFKPYFRKECSLQHAIAQAAQDQGIVADTPTIVDAIEEIEKQGTVLIDLAASLPIVGSFIPKESLVLFLTNYLTTTKVQIQEKRWDDLALPQIDLSAVTLWFGRISTAVTIGSLLLGGPIPFLIKRFVMPTIISWITAIFKTRFANSESTYLQVLAGLDDISTDLINAVTAIASLPSSQQITMGVFLDQIAPLLKNKALLNIAAKFFELNNQAHLIPYVQAIPEFLKALEPYRDRQVRDLLKMDTLMSLFHAACQFEFVKKIFEDTEFKDILARMPSLTPEFLAAFSHLSFEEVIGVVKVIAHPDFFNFLKKLPPQTSFAELILWLKASPDTVPLEVKDALNELMIYQSNHERIAEDSKMALLTLKEKFSLTHEKLNTDLVRITPSSINALSPEKTKELAPITPEPQTPWLMYGAITLGLTLLVLYNIFFFTTTVLLTSLILVAWVTYPIIIDHIIPMFTATSSPDLEDNAPTAEHIVEPILVYSSTNNNKPESTKTDHMECAFSVKKEQETTLPTTQAAYNKYGLFKPTGETQIPAIIALEASQSLIIPA